MKQTLTLNKPGTAMKSFVYNQNALRERNKAETIRNLGKIASVYKQVCATVNRMSYWTMMDALDALKHIPQCKEEIKKQFMNAKKMYLDHEKNLRWTNKNRFFHVADMDDETRSKYRKDLTDSEYFQLWLDTGDCGYSYYSKQLIMMRKKFERYMRENGDGYPEYKAKVAMWGLCVNIAANIYDSLTRISSELTGIDTEILESVFSGFSLKNLNDKLGQAIAALDIACNETYQLDEVQQHDIGLSQKQLQDAIMNEVSGLNGVAEAVEMNSHIFANRRTFRHVHQGIIELGEDTNHELRKLSV